MVKDSEHDTEGALTELLYNFITESKMLIVTHHILLLIRVETVIRCLVDLSVAIAARQIRVVFVFLSLANVKEVYHIVLKDLFPFSFPE